MPGHTTVDAIDAEVSLLLVAIDLDKQHDAPTVIFAWILFRACHNDLMEPFISAQQCQLGMY